jgi:hypothetical protein
MDCLVKYLSLREEKDDEPFLEVINEETNEMIHPKECSWVANIKENHIVMSGTFTYENTQEGSVYTKLILTKPHRFITGSIRHNVEHSSQEFLSVELFNLKKIELEHLLVSPKKSVFVHIELIAKIKSNHGDDCNFKIPKNIFTYGINSKSSGLMNIPSKVYIPWSLEIFIESNFDLSQIEMDGCKYELTEKGKTAHIKVDSKENVPRSPTLKWMRAIDQDGIVLLNKAEHDNEYYLYFCYYPEIYYRISNGVNRVQDHMDDYPLDFIFFLDRSHDMIGKKYETQKALLRACVKRLMPQSRFSIFSHGIGIEKITSNFTTIDNNDEEIESVLNSIDDVYCNLRHSNVKIAIRKLPNEIEEVVNPLRVVFFSNEDLTHLEEFFKGIEKTCEQNIRFYYLTVLGDICPFVKRGFQHFGYGGASSVRNVFEIEKKAEFVIQSCYIPYIDSFSFQCGSKDMVDNIIKDHDDGCFFEPIHDLKQSLEVTTKFSYLKSDKLYVNVAYEIPFSGDMFAKTYEMHLKEAKIDNTLSKLYNARKEARKIQEHTNNENDICHCCIPTDPIKRKTIEVILDKKKSFTCNFDISLDSANFKKKLAQKLGLDYDSLDFPTICNFPNLLEKEDITEVFFFDKFIYLNRCMLVMPVL